MATRLYSGNNTHTVDVEGLTNQSGEPIDDATVTMTIYESGGVKEVSGVTWPVSLTALGDGGYYSGTFNAYDSIQEGKKYVIRITAESDGNQAELERSVMAEKRRF